MGCKNPAEGLILESEVRLRNIREEAWRQMEARREDLVGVRGKIQRIFLKLMDNVGL